MATYIRTGLPEAATALAALTGEPHPLAISTGPQLRKATITSIPGPEPAAPAPPGQARQ